MADPKPPRTPWGQFPDVVIHADERRVKQHSAYKAAKSGNADQAFRLVQDTISETAVEALRRSIGRRSPLLVSAHALEDTGVNAIPEALSNEPGRRLMLRVDASVVETDVVAHTGADGFSRLARQASFDGRIERGSAYLLVDDFVGQGGTLANLKGFVEANGGSVIAATVLTGKAFSAKLAPTAAQLAALRAKHGSQLENWWRERFGHAFDSLTQSEARYLEHTADADTIRDRIVASEQTGDRGAL